MAQLVGIVQAKAGFDFKDRYATGNKRADASYRGLEQLFVARRPSPPDGTGDAATGAINCLARRPSQPHLKVAHAIAGIDYMGVTVDEPGRHPGASESVHC